MDISQKNKNNNQLSSSKLESNNNISQEDILYYVFYLLLGLLAISLLFFIYKRYKQSQKIKRIKNSINTFVLSKTKKQLHFKKASGQGQTNSDRANLDQNSTIQEFQTNNIFEQTRLSSPSTNETTMNPNDMSIDQGQPQPDLSTIFQKNQNKKSNNQNKGSKNKKRLASKAKVVQDQKNKTNQGQFDQF